MSARCKYSIRRSLDRDHRLLHTGSYCARRPLCYAFNQWAATEPGCHETNLKRGMQDYVSLCSLLTGDIDSDRSPVTSYVLLMHCFSMDVTRMWFFSHLETCKYVWACFIFCAVTVVFLPRPWSNFALHVYLGSWFGALAPAPLVCINNKRTLRALKGIFEPRHSLPRHISTSWAGRNVMTFLFFDRLFRNEKMYFRIMQSKTCGHALNRRISEVFQENTYTYVLSTFFAVPRMLK